VNKVQRLVTVETLGRWSRELLDLIERIVKAGATFRSLGDRLRPRQFKAPGQPRQLRPDNLETGPQ
jgi:hypothetical protein